MVLALQLVSWCDHGAVSVAWPAYVGAGVLLCESMSTRTCWPAKDLPDNEHLTSGPHTAVPILSICHILAMPASALPASQEPSSHSQETALHPHFHLQQFQAAGSRGWMLGHPKTIPIQGLHS